ncbi:MAG: SCP2 sterol-binding domain-containing protein [Mariprofundaceae bacterium]
MSRMFLPLRLIPVPVQCVVLTTVLELFFRRDTSLSPLLESLNDKVYRIRISDTGAVMWLGFSRGLPWVHPSFDGEVDVNIEASVATFARLCFAKEDPDDLVFQQDLKLSGDSEAMLRFKKLLAAADLDWELELRNAFGDFFGTRVAKAAHMLVATEAKVSSGTRKVAEDCLQSVEMPDSERLQAWQAGVEDLSRKVSRLKGRVTKFEYKFEDVKEARKTS